MFKTHGWSPFAMSMDDFIAWYTTRLEAAKGLCECCGEPFGSRIAVDHDHITGEVRALLCTTCNTIEGYGLAKLKKVVAMMRARTV
jgi:hypothetical protein